MSQKENFSRQYKPILKIAALCFLLGAVTLLIYWRVWTYEFIRTDDPTYVFNNSHVRTGLHWENLKWAFSAVHSSNWHPLTWMSHMLDCAIYGLAPGGHHFTNVVFHIVNTILLFLIFTRMTKDVFASWFVAAVFALHPMHVESVAWIAERKDVLSAFFALLSIGMYSFYRRKPSGVKYFLTLAFFVFGLMSKPMLVTLPFVLILLDIWPLQRKGKIEDFVYEKIPFFLMSALSAIVTMNAQKEATVTTDLLPFILRLENAVCSYAMYLVKTFWPHPLALFYPYSEIDPLNLIGSVFLLASVSVTVWKWRSSKPYLLTGWLWFIGMLVPVIGLVQVGNQAMADRYTYLPMIGLLIMAAWGGPRFA